MRGRTNVLGGADGELILGAEIQNFTVAQGNNIVAGNFVQYEIKESDTRYDGSYGYGRYFFKSNGNRNFVLPCGNNRYIVQYVDATNLNIWFFVLVDVGNGFNTLSTISIYNAYTPHFCNLNDGNMALIYMESENSFTINIYDIQQSFQLISTYHLFDENIGSIGTAGIGQIEDTRIIVMKGWAIFACNYLSGNISGHILLEISQAEKPFDYYAQNSYFDWVPYPVGENKFICFTAFSDSNRHSMLFEVEGTSLNVIEDNSSLFPQYSYIGNNVWGLGFLDGKMLYTKTGKPAESPTVGTNVIDYWKAYVLYVNNNKIMQSSEIDIYQIVANVFENLPIYDFYPVDTYSSGTIQFARVNVIYAAVMPYWYQVYGSYTTIGNPHCRTAIIRIEYNPNTGVFSNSNIITFESEDSFGERNARRFGFGKFFENENGDAYYLYETYESGTGKTGRWLMSLNYKNGILEMGERTEYVENYNGKTAIGVAKQSGKSGDKIEVYVPKPV